MLHKFLCFRHSDVPLVDTDLLSVLPLLLAGYRCGHTHLGCRRAVGLALRLLSVSAHLPAGALRLARRNVVAIAGAVARGQQKIPAAIVAAAGLRCRWQAPAKFGPQKIQQIIERGFSATNTLAPLLWVHHGERN